MAAPKYGFKASDVIASGRVKQEDLNAVKSWQLSTDLPQLSDEQAVLFLISCNGDVEFAKVTVRMYFDCKRNGPELFDDRDMRGDALKQISKTLDIAVLPTRTAQNYAVILCRFKDTAYYNFHVDRMTKLVFMEFELILNQAPPCDGLVMVFDVSGMGLMHLTRARLGPIRKAMQYVQQGMPLQLRAVHVLNVVYFFDKVLAILKPFMSKELFNMIKTHPPNMEMEEFFKKHLPSHCLPADYGGTLSAMESLTAKTHAELGELELYFMEEEAQREVYKRQKK